MSENSKTAGLQQAVAEKQALIDVAMGRKKADLVLKNAVYVNVFSNELCRGDIAITKGRIAGMGSYEGKTEIDVAGKIVCPGFIDAHIHLESSLVSPREFAKAVVPHGTTTVVTDPHEIANVMGTDGIEYMLQSTENLPVDVLFMLPSCVPSTPLDEAGAELDHSAIDGFYAHPRVLGLAEMMNAFGVIHNDPQVLEKLAGAQSHGALIDGHAPGILGKELAAYAAAGVRSDHECSQVEEALEKLRCGQYIMVRDGTAARNLEALTPLLKESYADRCVFCTDDKHPIDLLEKGHIDYIIRTAVSCGVEPITAIKAATRNPAEYFGLRDRGAIAPGFRADLTVIDGFERFHVELVIKRGAVSCEGGVVQPFAAANLKKSLAEKAHDTFRVARLRPEDFRPNGSQGVIGLVAGEIISTDNGRAEAIDPEKDILRIAVIERHKGTGHIGLGYIQGYGLKSGAVATSISHDSHNIIVVGTNEADMAFAANRVVENRGGIVVAEKGKAKGEVVLEIAGLMSDDSLISVNRRLEEAKEAAFRLGASRGIDPFMTLSFMSLPVIPTLRLTTRGMVDVLKQEYI